MANHFIRITSNGGYFGRICWCNSGAPGNEGLFGSVTLMRGSIFGFWAGSIPIIRSLTR